MNVNLSDLPADLIKMIAIQSNPFALRLVNRRLKAIIESWLTTVNDKIGAFCQTRFITDEGPTAGFIRRCHQLRDRALWLNSPIAYPFTLLEDFKLVEVNLAKLKSVQDEIKAIDSEIVGRTVALHLQMEDFPESLPEIWTAVKSNGSFIWLGQIHLCRMNLRFLPNEIGDVTHLRKLNLSLNKLRSLPSTIGNLICLRQLFLNGNELTSIPEEIGQLTKLKKLHLHCNHIARLPEEIVKLERLEELLLTSNKISNLPWLFPRLTSLRVLNVDNNQFTEIPDEMIQLPALEDLSIHGNRLRDLPQSIKQMPRLRLISVSYNWIVMFPATLESENRFRLVGRYAQHPLPF